MTTLDLEDYDQLVQDTVGEWETLKYISAILLIVFALGGIASFIAAACVKRERTSDVLFKVGAFALFISALYLGAGFALSEHVYANTPSFGDYVSESYAVEFKGLPDDKPDNGSIPVVWKEGESVHSGTVNIMDGKLSIKETNGDYLEVWQ